MGIAHRDVKPENIMINPKTGDIKYLDFGISCMEDDCERKNVNAGTLYFMAPELMNPELKIDLNILQKTDIFSLALTIIAILILNH